MYMRGRKDRWLQGIFAGMIANSIMIALWVPLFFELEPGQPYRPIGAGLVALVVIPVTLVYGIVLAFMSTKHRRLKACAVILNLTPILIIIMVVALLALAGHMPAE